ncbi:MAG: metallophosphoesterase [Caulobacteraceae bacterium]|nr:metallophosphoesterase [Caulobacteraceae bacterium]
MKLIHLSDIHFGGENREAVAGAAAFIDETPCDLVIVSGDLTRWAEVEEFQAARAWLDAIRRPLLVTPGNHDAPYLQWAARVFTPFARFERLIGPASSQCFRGERLAVCGVNTARGAQPRLNWSKGQISRGQACSALATLAEPAGLRVVGCHHPLIEMIGGPMTARVWGGERAARRFAEGGVDLVLSGHIHAPFAWSYPYADGRTHAVGAGTLSVRERGAPPSFNVIDVADDQVRVTAQGWTGGRYEPWRTWALDRRGA